MTTRKKFKKLQRTVRSDEYKKEAVKLSDTVGVTEAAKQILVLANLASICRKMGSGGPYEVRG